MSLSNEYEQDIMYQTYVARLQEIILEKEQALKEIKCYQKCKDGSYHLAYGTKVVPILHKITQLEDKIGKIKLMYNKWVW